VVHRKLLRTRWRIVLAASLWRRNQASTLLTNKRWPSLGYSPVLGSTEGWLAASLNLTYNRPRDEVLPVARRLTALANTDGTTQARQTGGGNSRGVNGGSLR